MSKGMPKGKITKKVETKIREYFEKIANDIKPSADGVRGDSPKSQAN